MIATRTPSWWSWALSALRLQGLPWTGLSGQGIGRIWHPHRWLPRLLLREPGSRARIWLLPPESAPPEPLSRQARTTRSSSSSRRARRSLRQRSRPGSGLRPCARPRTRTSRPRRPRLPRHRPRRPRAPTRVPTTRLRRASRLNRWPPSRAPSRRGMSWPLSRRGIVGSCTRRPTTKRCWRRSVPTAPQVSLSSSSRRRGTRRESCRSGWRRWARSWRLCHAWPSILARLPRRRSLRRSARRLLGWSRRATGLEIAKEKASGPTP
mmetsp:Transcript_24345/g.61349  ORF Transcript_24345/g.61349 Transcript_24345/m.61349 type:complete len:265 (+) Transcript_24345:76-870(+)